MQRSRAARRRQRESDMAGGSDSSGGKIKAFVTNGGGTLTYRAILSVAILVIGFFAERTYDGINKLADEVGAQAKIVAAHDAQISNIVITEQNQWRAIGNNADKLNDHEHRISLLEGAKRPN